MATVVSWRLEEEKIVLSIVNEKGDKEDIEMPDDVYKEILLEGPPSEEKQLREIITKINDIRKKRVLEIGKIDEELEKNYNAQGDAQDALKDADSRTEILKWGAMIRSLQAQKAALDTRRHLVKLLYQEEGKLSLLLARKLRGR